MNTQTIHIGDWVKIEGQEGYARVERKLRKWRDVPGVIMLDRRLGKYWTYPKEQLIKVKVSKALYHSLRNGGNHVPEAV